jgi:HK97 family phage prohead protease
MTQAMKAGHYLTLNLRASQTADGPLKISGVANDASVTDSYGTRVSVSQHALDQFMDNSVMLLNHDVHNPVGKFTKAEYRGNKLYVEGEVDPDARTNTGANVAELCRKGILKAFSIRFDEYKETRQKDYTQIEAEALDEISIVTLPSNKASLFNMRSKGIEMHGAEELITQRGRRAAAGFKVGDRVEVKPGSAHTMGGVTMGGAGTVEEIGTPALGIRLDDMPDEMHKWYVADELEASDTPAEDDATGEMDMERSAVDARKGTTRAAGPLSLQLLTQRLGALISETKSDGDWYSTAYLVAVHDDFCVWSEYGEGTFYQQGYAVDAAGTVALTGTEQEVLPAWTVVGGADDENTQRSISEADMGAVVGEVLLRVRTQLGLDFQGEPVLHDGAILRAVREATAPEAPAATPKPATPAPDAPADVTIDEVRAKLRMALQLQ